MQAFEYASAKTISEAVSLLSQKGEKARILAGGTDIIVQVREGRRQVELLVDIKEIPEANELSYDPEKGLQIGAAVPCYRIYENELVAKSYPGLIDSVSIIGGIQIQSRATLGGNLCNASPAADSIPSLIVYGAVCNIAGADGTRQVPIEDFCIAPGRTVLKNGEFLVSFQLPPPKKNSGAYYLRFIPRNEMDIAVVGAGASVVLDEALSSLVEARIALGAVAPTPLLVREAADLLRGKPVSDEAIAAAAEAAQAAARPISDMRGSANQRRHLVGVLTRRTLKGAIERAKGEGRN